MRLILQALDAADWERLGELAAHGQVSFQLYQRLMQPRLRASVSPALLERLRASAREQTLGALALVATLVEILRACSAADVPVMVLKGMHLAHTVYDDVSARYMSDIDLLFRRADLPRATQVFKSLGYEIPHDVASLIDLAPGNHEYTLEHPRYGVNVDVHWSLTGANEAGIDEEEVWKRACTLTIGGQPALGMAQEDLLAHLCFHASHHHFYRGVGLRPLVDVARLCTHSPQPDWQRIRRNDEGLGLGTRRLSHPLDGTQVSRRAGAPAGAGRHRRRARRSRRNACRGPGLGLFGLGPRQTGVSKRPTPLKRSFTSRPARPLRRAAVSAARTPDPGVWAVRNGRSAPRILVAPSADLQARQTPWSRRLESMAGGPGETGRAREPGSTDAVAGQP